MAIANVSQGARRAPHEDPAQPSRRRLHLVRPQPKRSRRIANRLVFVGPALVLLSLLSVVVAQATMTQGQVQLNRLETQVAAAQTTRMDLELRVAQEQQPQSVIAAARRLGLAEPGQVSDISAADPQPSGGAAPQKRFQIRGRT